ncbi:head fiber protein [Sphingopyxis sp. C-1]|uniref:head fiber protein n=1 Tax=Sphingopyxis sp. C-1 TaxID=262667 RepID=UPI000A9F1C1D|nr:head fiber protein [Sphingopyxis sp. C-1]
MAAGSPVSQRNGRATTARPGTVLQAATQADSVAATVGAVVTDFNALLAKLRTAGIIA